jgi:hypothetical protein
MTVAAWLFEAGGAILIGIGGFFLFARPALLPEDLRYLQRTIGEIDNAVPRLRRWLRLVFTVLGGYVMATGILTIYVAAMEVRQANSWGAVVLAITGAASIGLMAVVNMLLHSAFRWLLAAVATLWIGAILAVVLS